VPAFSAVGAGALHQEHAGLGAPILGRTQAYVKAADWGRGGLGSGLDRGWCGGFRGDWGAFDAH